MSKEKWTPEEGKRYFWVGSDATAIEREFNRNDSCDYTRFQCGNYFRTIEEAQEAAEKFKELLLSLHEVKEDKKTVLPKLTAKIFDRPDCPEWAMYAAVDFSGNAYFYKYLPRHGAIKPHWVGGEPKQYIGNYAWMDWENSLVKRPEPEFPEWCQKGKWVCFYDRFKKKWEYFKVNEVKRNCISSDNGLEYSFYDLKPARLRPWTFEEAPIVLKVEDPYGIALAYLSPFGGKYVIAYHHSDEFEKLKLGEVTFTFSAFADIFTQLDGSPCGVLEHLENGEWVE
jgi:hypothetical protein